MRETRAPHEAVEALGGIDDPRALCCTASYLVKQYPTRTRHGSVAARTQRCQLQWSAARRPDEASERRTSVCDPRKCGPTTAGALLHSPYERGFEPPAGVAGGSGADGQPGCTVG